MGQVTAIAGHERRKRGGEAALQRSVAASGGRNCEHNGHLLSLECKAGELP